WMDGQRVGSQDDARATGAGELPGRVREAVREVHGGRRGVRSRDADAASYSRVGTLVAIDAGALGRRERSRTDARPKHRQASGRRAQPASDVQLVAGVAFVAPQQAPRTYRSKRGRVDDERTGRAREIAADERRAGARAEHDERVDQG